MISIPTNTWLVWRFAVSFDMWGMGTKGQMIVLCKANRGRFRGRDRRDHIELHFVFMKFHVRAFSRAQMT